MRIALIPTGDLELRGLAHALAHAFPAHDFHVVAFTTAPPEPKPFHSFTSAPLPLPSLHDPGSSLSELIGAIVDQLYPKATCDRVLVLEDLELANMNSAAVVVAEVRGAIERHLARVASRDPMAARTIRQMLRTSASFHLAVPMIESWLFADPAGPANAGAPPAHLPAKLHQGRDPEQFLTDDQAYSQDQGGGCTAWLALPPAGQSRARPEWLKAAYRREEHPKRYMAWLCRSAKRRNGSTYCDDDGAEALKRLAWGVALSQPTHMGFMRSLVIDLADALASSPAFHVTGTPASLTSIHHLPPNPLLRNL